MVLKMSGPSTRSHRSSVRGVEATLAELSDLLKANKSILIISGAGLSVASGKLLSTAGGYAVRNLIFHEFQFCFDRGSAGGSRGR